MTKPRHGARVDDIQPAIVADLTALGVKCEVLDVSREGVPDLLCGFLGRLTLLECKSRLGKLSEAQQRERDGWAAVGIRVEVVRSVPEARRALGVDSEGMARRRKDMAAMVPGTEYPKGRTTLDGRHVALTSKGIFIEGNRMRPSVRRYGQ